LITGRDLRGDGIDHALAVSLLGTELRSGFVAPAIAEDTGAVYSGTIPMGSRLGIPRDAPVPDGLSPLGRDVWDALVEYGAFVVDQHVGTVPVMFYADPRSVPGGDVNAVRAPSRGNPSDLDRIMPFLRVVQQ
jgi:hypothetical protein